MTAKEKFEALRAEVLSMYNGLAVFVFPIQYGRNEYSNACRDTVVKASECYERNAELRDQRWDVEGVRHDQTWHTGMPALLR